MGIVAADPELVRALCVSLAPWNYSLIEVAPSPGSHMLRATRTARALTQRHDLIAVAWLDEDEEGASLWVYDATHDDVTVRQVTAPPYDDATAAAVALSLKTSLRAPRWTETGEAAAQPATATQLPGLAQPQPRSPGAYPPAPTKEEPSVAGESPSPLRLLIEAAGRIGALEREAWDATYGLQARFAWRNTEATHSGSTTPAGPWLGAAAQANVPVRLVGQLFEGTYVEYRLALSGGWAWPLSADWSWGIRSSLGGRYSTLSGTALVEGVPVSATRIRPLASLGAELRWQLGSQQLMLHAAGYAASHGQRYLIERSQLLRIQPVWGELGLSLSL